MRSPYTPLGLAGDEVGDKRFHGGPDKAVYAFAREDLDLWALVGGSGRACVWSRLR